MQPSFVASEVRMFPNARIAVAAASLLVRWSRPALPSISTKLCWLRRCVTRVHQDGEMLPPADYREWIFLTSGIDMSYNPRSAGTPDHSMFDNVFVNPEAYHSFLETGTWPDKTMMVLESREARSKGSINQRGHFQDRRGDGL